VTDLISDDYSFQERPALKKGFNLSKERKY